ncbi:MAG: hypothetical protein IPH53_01265 [Flavobacteriales bacterium]|nr:hypothetical protein [Flavobacteriales bacterium]
MRSLALVSAFLTLPFANAQVVTSVVDGNWHDPLTWDCACVPGGDTSVVIGHAVNIVQPDTLGLGDLILVLNGSLDGSALSHGGAFYNNGFLLVDRFELRTTPFQVDAVNFGSIEVQRFEQSREGFVNLGFLVADTLDSYALWENEMEGRLEVDLATGPGAVINHGIIEGTGLWAAAFVNDSNFTWIGTIHVQHSSINDGNIALIGDLVLASGLEQGGLMLVEGNVTIQGDLDLDADTALISVQGDLINYGTVGGEGVICVSDSTFNGGVISGTLDLCDITRTALAPPFLDVNTGTVGDSVVFATTGSARSMPSSSIPPCQFLMRGQRPRRIRYRSPRFHEVAFGRSTRSIRAAHIFPWSRIVPATV